MRIVVPPTHTVQRPAQRRTANLLTAISLLVPPPSLRLHWWARSGKPCLGRHGPSRCPRPQGGRGEQGSAHRRPARRGSSCAWRSGGRNRSCAWRTAGPGSPRRAPDTPRRCRPGTGTWAPSTGGLHRLGWGKRRETVLAGKAGGGARLPTW